MLLIVAGGYWFTVRPVFQHQLLQEKAARLELDIIDKEERLESFVSALNAAEEQGQIVQDQLLSERQESVQLAQTIQDLEVKE